MQCVTFFNLGLSLKYFLLLTISSEISIVSVLIWLLTSEHVTQSFLNILNNWKDGCTLHMVVEV